jgi:general secretion pathway protein C
MDRLFGAPHDDHPTASSAGIRLLGTMAFVGDATRGMAIVDIDGRSHLWLVGATLADAQLKEVYPDHIVIERASHAELVAMPKSDGGLGAGRVAAHHVVPTPPPISREAIHHRIAAATAPLAAVLVAEPLMNGDQYSGLIVNPNGNAYAFKQLGLKPGDIIMAVNQRQLNPDTLQFLNEDIRSGRPVRLYVNRPGVGPVDIPINTAAIN